MAATQETRARKGAGPALAFGVPLTAIALAAALFVFGAVIGADDTGERRSTQVLGAMPGRAIEQSAAEWHRTLEGNVADASPDRDAGAPAVIDRPPRFGAHGTAGPLATGDETLQGRDVMAARESDAALQAAIAEFELLHDPALMGALSAVTPTGDAMGGAREPTAYDVIVEPWMLQAYGDAVYAQTHAADAVGTYEPSGYEAMVEPWLLQAYGDAAYAEHLLSDADDDN